MPESDGAQHLVAVDARTDSARPGRWSPPRRRARANVSSTGCLKWVDHESWQLPRVGDVDQWPSDVLGVRRVDTRRHLAEAVVVVPDVQVAHGYAAAPQLVGDEVRHQELAQVAQVHPPRRRDARRAGHRPLGTGLLVMPDRVVGGASHPVMGLALRLWIGTSTGLRSGWAVTDGHAIARAEPARSRFRRDGSRDGRRAPASLAGALSTSGRSIPRCVPAGSASAARRVPSWPLERSNRGSAPVSGTKLPPVPRRRAVSVLSALGVSAEDERRYQQVLPLSGSSVREIGDPLGVDPDRVPVTLAGLIDLGVVRIVDDRVAVLRTDQVAVRRDHPRGRGRGPGPRPARRPRARRTPARRGRHPTGAGRGARTSARSTVR